MIAETKSSPRRARIVSIVAALTVAALVSGCVVEAGPGPYYYHPHYYRYY